MDDNGYRPPQFSEETAWLPVWLQSCRVSYLADQPREADSFPQASNHALLLQEISSDGQDCSSERARYSNCDLFLSGEDLCSVGNSLSIEKALPFQLYLSSEASGQSLSQFCGQYGERVYSDKMTGLKCIPESSVVKNVEGLQEKLTDIAPVDNMNAQKVSAQKYNSHCPRLVSNCSERRNINIGFDKNSDVDNAVALAIAASEALAISDMMDSSLTSEAFSASVILEIALRVKESRIQSHLNNADVSLISSEEVEMESLSDLDEETMADSFSDVGLSVNQVVVKDDSCFMQLNRISVNLKDETCNQYSLPPPTERGRNVSDFHVTAAASKICLAEECISFPSSIATHVSESPNGCLVSFQHLKGQEIDRVVTFSERNLVDAAAARQHELLATNRSPVPTNTPENLKGSEELDFDVKSLGSIHVKEHQSFSAVITGKHSEKSISIQPFESRWLGGWTGRELDLNAESFESFESQTFTATPSWVQDLGDHEVAKSAGLTGPYSYQHDNYVCPDVKLSLRDGYYSIKRRSNFFVEQTSFLSELVAVVDENSAADKPEECVGACGPEGNASCASSMPVEALGSNDNIVSIGSQVLASSNCSLDDPLCSVVECSVPDENANSDVDVASRLQDMELEKRKRLEPDTGTVNNQEFLFSFNKVIGAEAAESLLTSVRGVYPRMGCAGSEEIKRTLMTSLKNYSMLASFDKSSLGEHTEATICEDIIRSLDKSENNLQLLQSEVNAGCWKPLNLEKKTQCAALSKCGGRYWELANPVDISKCLHKQNGRQNGCTIRKKILEKVDVIQPVHALDDSIIMRRPDGNHSPLVWKNGTRRRLRPCRTIEGDANEEYTLNGVATPCLRRIPSRMLENESSCRDDANHNPPAQLQTISLEREPLIKKVRFSEVGNGCVPRNVGKSTSSQIRSCLRQRNDKVKGSLLLTKLRMQNKDGPNTRSQKRIIYRGFEFMLTGFRRNEKQELEMLIRKHGGVVLYDIPSPSPRQRGKRRPLQKDHILTVILSPGKLRTTKFLYGCAIHAHLLKVDWLMDSVSSGFVLPPDKYLLLPNQSVAKHMSFGQSADIFDRVAIMVYGKASFCTKFTKLIRHGGGRVFKTLHWLIQNLKNQKFNIGAIVVEDMGGATRHLRQCASEHKLNMMPASWIIGSLLSGKVLSFDANDRDLFGTIKEARVEGVDSSQEI